MKRQRRNYHKTPFPNNIHVGTNAPSPQPFDQGAYPQATYTQAQQSYSPHTPGSAASSGSYNWHGQLHQQDQMQHNQYAALQVSHQHQQTPYVSQLSSNSTTPVVSSHITSSAQQQASPTASRTGSVSQMSFATSSASPNVVPEVYVADSEPHVAHDLRGRNVDNSEDQEQEELNLLDVPDLPQTTRLFGNCP